MRLELLSGLALIGLLSSCSNVRQQFYLVESDAPFVYDIGELEPIGYDALVAAQEDMAGIPESVHYGRLGAGPTGLYGGATFEFRGTGGRVCVIADPEAMFWSMELDEFSNSTRYKYEDIYTDDGDVDMSVGLTAYYTGSPGQEIGDFEAVYTDELGVAHELEFNECRQVGYFGDPAHAGRATVEACEVDTTLRPGVLYTGLLRTFSLPIDDNVLNFGVMVYDGRCDDVPGLVEGELTTGVNECTIPNEVGNSEPNGLAEDKSWFPEVEQYYCGGKNKVNSWCKDNPGEGCQEPDEFANE
jgi:hypothetical protein